MHALISDGFQLFHGLDALGDHFCPQVGAQRDHMPNHDLTPWIFVDAADQSAV